MPVFLPEGYKKRKRKIKHYGVAKTGEVSPKGEVEQWEHWEGNIDAVAKPRAIGMKVRATADAPPDPVLVSAIHELEESAKEFRLAKVSGDAGWRKRTQVRFHAAKRRVAEIQQGR
jgi:ribosomal protein L32E